MVPELTSTSWILACGERTQNFKVELDPSSMEAMGVALMEMVMGQQWQEQL